MLPSILAEQLRQGLADYLRATFEIATPAFRNMLEDFLAEPGALFKGPYLQLGLPFRRGRTGAGPFVHAPLGFTPWLHQEQAFERLNGERRRSTIVATGTGSGKTECFFHPLLEYCAANPGPGVKAVIIYPMNALATDQAARIAKTIHGSSGLRNKITVGLYIGAGKDVATTSVMTSDSVITDRETLRLRPPHILLTNYKMLDYLLIRPGDAVLWAQNGPETLRFLVVDELHTFDGAQGTDLACLLRRLKDRLKTPKDFLCCVGTSATLGGPSAGPKLLRYASDVFGENFDAQALVTESRESPGEFLGEGAIDRFDLPGPERRDDLDPRTHPDYADYVLTQYAVWFGVTKHRDAFDTPEWRYELAERLKRHLFFQNLVRIARNEVIDLQRLGQELAKTFPSLASAPMDHTQHVLESILSLVSEARTPVMNDEGVSKPGVFLNVRLQLWMREMRRMVAEVGTVPRLRHADDLTEAQMAKHLPVLHCRECGSVYWTGLKSPHETVVRTELRSFYTEFFKKNSNKIIRLAPDEGGAEASRLPGSRYAFCASCMRLSPPDQGESCRHCQEKSVLPVIEPTGPLKDCPQCGAFLSLTLLGHQAATLTSVLISQFFASPFSEYKKLLTFSDNVQDAAHRAGFFGARTYRHNFRMALQRYLLDGGAGFSLDKVAGGFVNYWKSRMEETQFVATFLPPNLSWLSEYEEYKKHGKLAPGSRLLEFITNRMQWEVCSEYGFMARIGRTLEKACCSIAHPAKELLDSAVENVLLRLQNEIGELRNLDGRRLRAFLMGFLHTIRQRGAIFWPVLEGYIGSFGNTYHISQGFKPPQVPWMPNVGPSTRAPAFLTTRRDKDRFDALLGSGQAKSWYQHWALRTLFSDSPMAENMLGAVYDIVLKGLCEEKIIEERSLAGGTVWGIRPQALRVDTMVERLTCDVCGHGLSAWDEDSSDWLGTSCLRRHCAGHYQQAPAGPDYYANLYASGMVQRIFAEEHTGLLGRQKREEVEREFKEETERKPWYANLLSCTPTLEMGINIGELSATVQCSVPPAQANYLQRIGRSGRKDGNSVNVTIANASPHDLYFFADPEEMMHGEVEAPGVFLDASAVLERQFTAYCFDRWVGTGIPEAALPSQIKIVLQHFGKVEPTRFPYSLLAFIETNEAQLLEAFLYLFSDTLSKGSRERLVKFVQGGSGQEGSLHCRILDGLAGLKKELHSLKSKADRVYRALKKLKANPVKDLNYNDELIQLKNERDALNALIKSINDKNTLNFFTDEGLLPNYTFPEAGVTLRSIILRRTQHSEKNPRLKADVIEYERAASSAIRDLAPQNRFYAGGRAVTVDQVDLNVSQIETWRLCANCSYMHPVAGEEPLSSCPRCGDALWSDAGRKRQLLKLRQVIATTPDWKSRIADDSENREPKFFNQQMLVDTDNANIKEAFRIDDDEVPFGVEFLSKATIRELNFGEQSGDGPTVMIAGEETPRTGFTVCKHCGKVQNPHENEDHAFGCPKFGKHDDSHFTECLYLYREFDSEALKILLPVLSLDGSEGKVHSFIAALQLGLKLKFGGRIDHLRSTVHSEPMVDSKIRKQYLMVYDTVPGGTGYLGQLMRQETIFDVLQLACDRIQHCSCADDPKRDGCYSCLFAYRNSHAMVKTSRQNALRLLNDILTRRQKTVVVENLSSVRMDRLMDSVLEAMFIDALYDHSLKRQDVSIKKTPVRGKQGRSFKIGTRRYDIELQAELDPRQGVDVASRADFLFHPLGAQASKPVAVFTDGFAFHRNRLGTDSLQRMALMQSRRHLFWSLSYYDIKKRAANVADSPSLLDPAGKPSGNKLQRLLKEFGVEDFGQFHLGKPLQQFLELLEAPNEASYPLVALAYALTMADTDIGAEKFRQALADDDLGRAAIWFENMDKECLFATWRSESTSPLFKIYAAFPTSSIQGRDASGIRLMTLIEDGPEQQKRDCFESVWRNSLQCMNLFQFLPGACFLSRVGIENGFYEEFFQRRQMQIEPVEHSGEISTEEAWEDIHELTDLRLHGFLKQSRTLGMGRPEPGFELTDAKGAVIAFAEVAFETERLAIILENDTTSAVAFNEAGWRTCSIGAVIVDPNSCLEIPTL